MSVIGTRCDVAKEDDIQPSADCKDWLVCVVRFDLSFQAHETNGTDMTDPRQVRLQDSLIPGAINAVINGAIAYSGFKAETSIPMTLDLISSEQHTVWGQGVTLAFALGVILSIITAKVFGKHAAKADPALGARVQRPLSFVLRVAIGNAFALFGWFVALAVLWQRLLGSIEVSPVVAAVLVGLLAGVITMIVEVRTKRALLHGA